MNPDIASGVAGVYLFVVLFGLLLAILWVLVPFAIFGIKPLLRKIGSEIFTTNTLLEKIHKELQAQSERARQLDQP